MIKYILHKDINKQKWDNCIDNSCNGLIYAYSWYLDLVSPGWDALVEGDYESVMPLTWKSKFGIKYLCNPLFVQALGVFSRKNNQQDFYVDNFINSIPEKYKLIHISFNRWNKLEEYKNRTIQKTTYELDLNSTYQTLVSAYNKNNKKNIDKAIKNKVDIVSSADIQSFKSFYINFLKAKKLLTKEIDLTINKIFEEILNRNMGEIFFGYLNSKICSAVFVSKTSGRIIINTSSNKDGRKSNSVFLIIDSIIKNNSMKNIILDFAGSDIEGIAKRNSGYGAQKFHYLYLSINRLPFFINLIYKLKIRE